MKAYQLRCLQSLVRHAAANIPYYQELFSRNHVKPEDIRSLTDISKLPMTGKQHSWELHESRFDPRVNYRQLVEHKTSGSTGIPARIHRTLAEERRLNLLRWRMYWMLGLRPGDRLATVKTTWECLPRRFEQWQKLARKIRLVDRRIFDCFLPPTEVYQKLTAYQPHILSGYPGTLVRIAKLHPRQEGVRLAPRKIICGGEWLAPDQRRLLEESFQVPVYDTYGTTECNLLAWECPKTGYYHICDDGVLLEICRDGVPVPHGEPGEVVITSLHSRAMPFIRFQLGDLAVAGPSPCPCGSPFSSLQDLQGRITDFLQLPDGSQLHPFGLLNPLLLTAGEWIAEYQIVQKELNQIHIKIVPHRPVSIDEEFRLSSVLQEKVGAGVRLHIEQVRTIPSDANGKRYFCRSSVKKSI